MASFRFGMVVGGVAGYVLGARAGRQRYEQIVAAARSAARSRPAQQLSTEVRGMADRAGDLIGEKATEGVSRVTAVVRGGAGNGGGLGDDPARGSGATSNGSA